VTSSPNAKGDLLRLARRCCVLIALMFWLGGFTFYASIVVPIGTRILGSPLRQGFITREVTGDLNVAAALGLLVLAWDVLALRGRWHLRRWSLGGLWLVMAACQALLFALHAHLDGMLRAKGLIVTDPDLFHSAHRAYLWIHTVQWGAGLAFLPLMLRSWQVEDRAVAAELPERAGVMGEVGRMDGRSSRVDVRPVE
jgi:hypothetical protein